MHVLFRLLFFCSFKCKKKSPDIDGKATTTMDMHQTLTRIGQQYTEIKFKKNRANIQLAWTRHIKMCTWKYTLSRDREQQQQQKKKEMTTTNVSLFLCDSKSFVYTFDSNERFWSFADAATAPFCCCCCFLCLHFFSACNCLPNASNGLCDVLLHCFFSLALWHLSKFCRLLPTYGFL